MLKYRKKKIAGLKDINDQKKREKKQKKEKMNTEDQKIMKIMKYHHLRSLCPPLQKMVANAKSFRGYIHQMNRIF